jgi:adenosine deaminase
MFRDSDRTLLHAFQEWHDLALDLERGHTQLEFIMVVPRTLDAERLARDAAEFIELKRAGLIVGVAVVGVENGESLARFGSTFERWRDAGLGIEIHAGEHFGPDSVRDALDYGRPDRIGHGVSAFQDADLIKRLRDDGIHLEFCLTSNLRTHSVSHLMAHPARAAKTLGLDFSLNTDNPGMFDCSLEGEYVLAQEALGFDLEDLQAVTRHALRARFQPALRHAALRYDTELGNMELLADGSCNGTR